MYVADKGPNEVSQFATRGSGALRPLTPKTVASGPFPYDVAVSPQGTSVYAVDNPSGAAGEVSQYTINPATGKLTPKSPKTVPTAKGPSGIIAVAPNGKNAYVPDFTAKAISQYSISPATGKLAPLSRKTVADPRGPTGIKVAPDSRYVYVTNTTLRLGRRGAHASTSKGKAGTVSVFRMSPGTGALSSRPVETVATGHNPQMITIAPDGKSAYVAATNDNTIWQYSINPATGKIAPMSPATVATGKGPHDLAVAPDGKNLYVITVANDAIAQYAISPRTGALSAKPVSTAATVSAPEAIALTPDGEHAYVTSEHDGDLSQFAITPATGEITPLSPATVTIPPGGSLGLAITPAADLAVKVTAPASAQHGQALTYAITITNSGPSDAWQAALTDHLPAGTAFRSASAASGRCSHPSAGTRGATVKCRLGKLNTGGAWRIQVNVTIKASSGTLRDKAAVISVTPDPHRSNNTTSTATTING